MSILVTTNQPGYVTTSTTTTTAVRGTIYTEQVAGAQRSIVSSSANDASAGTGARKVLITYYNSTLTALNTELVTLNGVTPVNTTNTDICFIEKMEVQDVGSVNGNVGTISLFTTTGGGGSVIGSIAPGDNQTNWCHHYVLSNVQACITYVQGGVNGASSGSITLRKSQPSAAVAQAELVIIPQLRVASGPSNQFSFLAAPIVVNGPARITLYAQQDAASDTNTWYAGFAFYEN